VTADENCLHAHEHNWGYFPNLASEKGKSYNREQYDLLGRTSTLLVDRVRHVSTAGSVTIQRGTIVGRTAGLAVTSQLYHNLDNNVTLL
jgi:hypothetical protein